MIFGKRVEWNEEKNAKLLAERGVGFEEVYAAIQNGFLLSVVNGKVPKYQHQKVFVVSIEGYTYAVPFVEDDKKIFLKTLYPSRDLHHQYHRGENRDG